MLRKFQISVHSFESLQLPQDLKICVNRFKYLQRLFRAYVHMNVHHALICKKNLFKAKPSR